MVSVKLLNGVPRQTFFLFTPILGFVLKQDHNLLGKNIFLPLSLKRLRVSKDFEYENQWISIAHLIAIPPDHSLLYYMGFPELTHTWILSAHVALIRSQLFVKIYRQNTVLVTLDILSHLKNNFDMFQYFPE